MSDFQQPISTDRALELLVRPQRRQILRGVADTADGTTVDQLEEQLAVVDPSGPDGADSVAHRGLELHHVHLPKLHEADVIEYDANQGTVHRGRQFQDVFALLEVIDEHREDSSTIHS